MRQHADIRFFMAHHLIVVFPMIDIRKIVIANANNSIPVTCCEFYCSVCIGEYHPLLKQFCIPINDDRFYIGHRSRFNGNSTIIIPIVF